MPSVKLSLSSVQNSFPEYKVVRYIKSGGFKDVYLIEKDSHKYVLKLLDPRDIVRITREITAFQLIRSPYIARMVQYGKRAIESKTFIFFIEEFVDGKELGDLINSNKKFDNKEILHFLYCCVLAVEKMWGPHRIVHRDIKPSNIIIKPSGDAVILDFGIARHTKLSSITPTGFVGPGTPGYRSPEQLKGIKRDLDLRSDLFCLGICAFMMATLCHPFQKDDLKIADENFIPKSPLQLNNAINNSVSDLIMKFIDRKIYKRPKDCRVAIDLINEAKRTG